MNLFRDIATWVSDPIYMDGGIVHMVVFGTIGGEPANMGAAFGLPKEPPHTEWYHL